jgi:predicted dienelactone hydrolase
MRAATLLLLALPALASAKSSCLRTAGDRAAACFEAYVAALAPCREANDAACEMAAKADGGPIAQALAAVEVPIGLVCTDEEADRLGYVGGVADIVRRARDSCADFAEDHLATVLVEGLSERCARIAPKKLGRLHRATVALFGPRCFVRAAEGGRCVRRKRDRGAARLTRTTVRRLRKHCPAAEEQVATVFDHSRHFAQQVYPPNDLGPSAAFGPSPVGVRTLDLFDASRMNAAGTGPRPVKLELYYPSTPEAVAGVPRDIAQVLGIDIVATPSYRDVARAPGRLPVVLFSHGNGGIRFQSLFLMIHLASHGYLVATPDHHGNTFVDLLSGTADPDVATNRPIDMTFVLDQLLAFDTTPGDFLAGGVDAERVGMSGHSFGGFTSFALAGEDGSFMFRDLRMKAILPLAPAALMSPAFFGSITVPTLIVGGSLDSTTPFAAHQRTPWGQLPSGAPVVGLAEIVGAGHFTFSDICEPQRELTAVIGGFDEACEPRHLPWRHAHDLINYLALNFFDAVLTNDAEALARLAPDTVNAIDDLNYETK